jgi:hypothetical protein
MSRRKILSYLSGLVFLAAITLSAAPAATAGPPMYPWNVDTYDFGTRQGAFTFIYTNINPLALQDKPLPMQYADAFHVSRDTCTAPVAPGRSCSVTVTYTPQGEALADTLQLLFKDPSGRPVATPGVRLFAGGAEYLTTDYLGNIVTFPDTGVGSQHDLRLIFHIHGPNPIDIPPFLIAPWGVIGNTCSSVQPGATSCVLAIAFKPTAAGTFATHFQMSFTDPITRQAVSVPVVTLQGTAR